jgi:tryptophanyl-tRNA synthetase
MAADILIYKPDGVPVGEDQIQHLELARTIARKFNRSFGKTFPEPKASMLKPLRIMSLMDPEKKMSKTGDEALMISDSPEIILKKLKKAVTGSEPKEKTPGVINLLDLLERFGAEDKAKEFNAQIKTGDIKYSDLKTSLAHVVSDYFAEFRERKAKIMEDKNYIADVLSEGAKKARVVAGETLSEVKEKIGLL